MKRFEEFVVTRWSNWDCFGSDWYFYDCDLNPEFWVGAEDDLKDIYTASEVYGTPTVYFSFDDTGYIIQIYFNTDVENTPHWAYQGQITRGPKIES